MIDRFAQIEPKVLLAVDGYRYGGKDFDRRETSSSSQRAMPTLERTVVLPYLDPDPDLAPRATRCAGTSCWPPATAPSSSFERVPFDHPLWVLYSSGTTGLPKAIVHGQGGILLEHLKKLQPAPRRRSPATALFWFTTTGWMMWNFLVSAPAHRRRDRPLRRQPRAPGHGACSGTSPSAPG